MDNIGPDEDDDFTDIREQIFHNTVREQIVSIVMRCKWEWKTLLATQN